MTETILLGVAVVAFALLAGGMAVMAVMVRSSRSGESSTQLLMQQQIESLRAQVAESMEKNRSSSSEELHRIMQLVNERLKENSEALSTVTGNVGERLDRAARVMGDVQKQLGSLDETTRQVLAVRENIARLEEILKPPKARGGFGESLLSSLLEEMLPRANFELQHRFSNGETVDAVVKLAEKMVPVDSKFPLENFLRVTGAVSDDDYTRARKQFFVDVRKHVDAISSKYIRPDEGTFDFALMYIPAENVYYETIVKDDRLPLDEKSISSYALARRVIPVSPNSFYAYLRAILLGLKGLQVEENALKLIQGIGRLKTDLDRFDADFRLVGKHLSNARSKYEEAERRLDRFGDRLRTMESGTALEESSSDETLPLLS